MVPAHIEQDCNAYDAVNHNAGIVANDFQMDKLLEFAGKYQPNREFHHWVECAPYIIRCAVELEITTHISTDHMYMVEEFA